MGTKDEIPTTAVGIQRVLIAGLRKERTLRRNEKRVRHKSVKRGFLARFRAEFAAVH
jgi:hypothetical protein